MAMRAGIEACDDIDEDEDEGDVQAAAAAAAAAAAGKDPKWTQVTEPASIEGMNPIHAAPPAGSRNL